MYAKQESALAVKAERYPHKDLVMKVMKVLNESGLSYKEKERALHWVNEVLFYELVTK